MRQHERPGKAIALAEEQGDDEGGDAGGRMHNQAAREIEHAQRGGQPSAAPDPVGHGGIDDEAPQGAETDHPSEPRAVHPGADHQGRGDRREGKLEQGEGAFRNGQARADIAQIDQHPGIAGAQPSVAHRPEGQSVAHDDPQQGSNPSDRADLKQHGQEVLRPDQPAIEKPEAGQGHQQDERGAEQHERGIAAVARRRIGILRPCGAGD